MTNLKIGIVGLPNVGKSSLFNLLTHSSVPAQNYPFCTIDPNVGIVKIEDERLEKLAHIVESDNIVPAVVEFVDIAGLVRGAHKGEGLGNQFLANIREVEIILHVLRDFEDKNVEHVEKRIDPVADADTVEIELVLKDLETITNSCNKYERAAKKSVQDKEYFDHLQLIKSALEDQKMAKSVETPKNLFEFRKSLNLLTDKKILYLINTNKEDFSAELKKFLDKKDYFKVNLKLLEELSEMNELERVEFIQELDLETADLVDLIKKCYISLGLISFFTAGQKEVRAWTIAQGATAKEAAGVIHTDFSKNFIAAEVVSFEDFVVNNGWLGSRNNGKVRLEGSSYVFNEGDVVIFKHGA